MQGMEDAWRMVEETDALLSNKRFNHETLVISTGVIGRDLSIEKTRVGIRD
jgi:glutamate N-acetyltransferase / amino-acid N-acetyltransferase